MKNPTNNAVIDLFAALKEFKGHLGVKFNMGICDNLFHTEEICKPLIAQSQRIQELIKEYEIERVELAKKYAEKDDKGEPKIIKGDKNLRTLDAFDISAENQKELEEELKKLKAGKYKKQFAQHEKESADFLKVLEEECKKFKPTYIDRGCIPNTVTTEELKAIYILIKK